MRLLRFLGRLFGWLLTPLVASAASFFGALLGALVFAGLDDPMQALILTVALAAIAAVVAAFLCLRFLQYTPEVRRALQLDETGMPALEEQPPEAVEGEMPALQQSPAAADSPSTPPGPPSSQ